MTKVKSTLALVVSACLVAAAWPATASACANADRTAATMSKAQVARALRCVITAERRARGLHGLRNNRRLARAARRHARDMVRRRYFGHGRRGARGLLRRVARTGYFRHCMPCRVGENLHWGAGPSSRPSAVVQSWLNSAPHRAVLLAPEFRKVGIGLARGTPRRRDRRAITTTMIAGT